MVSDSETGMGQSRREALQSYAAGLRRRAAELRPLVANLKSRAVELKPYAAQANNWRERWRLKLVTVLKPLLRNAIFDRFITALILVNAVTLGMETSETIMSRFGGLLALIDQAILTVFVLELGARMIVFGTRFWKDPWSVFDFLVVAVTFLPASDNISVLRALRIIRALRLVSAVPSMRRVVNGLLAAIPGMTSIVVLLLLIFYVFSVMATNMFAETLPDRFGTLGDSLLTLFQVMSLDGWTGEVARPVMAVHPWSWVFFLVFILITSFTVLNLFIGIIVDGMQQQHEETRSKKDLLFASRFGKFKGISVKLGQEGDSSVAPPADTGAKASATTDTRAVRLEPKPANPLAALRAAVAMPARAIESTEAGVVHHDPRIDRLLDEIKALREEVRGMKADRRDET
jgi:voltage-gated sodium channel